MIKQWVFFMMTLGIFSLPLMGDTEASSQNAHSMKQTLTYSQSHWEPLVMTNNKIMSGIIADYLNLLESKTSLKFHYRYEDKWTAVTQSYNAGKIDFIPGVIDGDMEISEEHLSKPFLKFKLILAGSKSQDYISRLTEIEEQDLVVAVMENSSVINYLKKNYPNIRIYYVNTIQEGLLSIEQKKADLFIELAPIVAYCLQNEAFFNIKIVGILRDELKLMMAIKDTSLVPLFNQGIDAISQEETDAIFHKYIKKEIQEENHYLLSYKMIAFELLIVAGFIAWLYVLKREIRKRRLAEKKAKLANKRLHRVAEELKMAMTKTAHAHQIKSQFIANMRHEIKTPMNTIIAMTELVLRKQLPERERLCLTKVSEASNHLMDIINDILDFSKIEANSIQLEAIPFQFEKLILSISNLLRMRAQQKGLEFLIDLGNTPNYLYIGDPKRLKQVLFNIVSNAVKFTHKGEILISLKIIEEIEGIHKIRFEIRDTGIGMTQEQEEGLFTAFSQADMSQTRNFGGTGLGLSVAQGLVIMMGGEIQCKSVYGEGSSFSFEIPLKIDTSFVAPTQPHLPNKLKVLVVDHNQTTRKILAKDLSRLGTHCKICKNGYQTLELLEKEFPADVALIDWKIEDIDIATLLQLIKQHYERKIAVIITVSAFDKEALLAKLTSNIKPYAIMVKPISISTLHETLSELYEKHIQAEPTQLPLMSALEKLATLSIIDNQNSQKIIQDIFIATGINSSYAIQNLGGNTALYYQLLKIFVKEQINFQKNYQNLIRDKDFMTAKRLCYTLKGIAATLGMEDLSALAQQAELLDHSLDENNSVLIDKINIKIHSLSTIIEPVLQEITKEKVT